MKSVFLASCILLLFTVTSFSQTYLHPDWLVQPDLPLSTGPVYIADAVKTLNNATFVIGDFQNGADFDLSATDTDYVQAEYNHSEFLAKYDRNGKLLFEVSFGSSFYLSNGYNFFTAVTSDADGNAYITGSFGYGFDFDPGPGVVTFPAGYYDRYMFVAKYDKNGHFLWADPITTFNNKTYSGPVTVDRQSNVYIAGTIAGNNNDFDPGPARVSLNGDKNGDGFFAKYDKNGAFLFAKLITGSDAEGIDRITTDRSNNLLVTGYYSTGTNDVDPGPDTVKLTYKGGGDIFFAKYSPDGAYVFAKSVGGKGSESASGILTDSKNNIIITGSFTGTNEDFDPGKGKVLRSAVDTIYNDVFTEKFDSLGNYKWVSTAGGSSDDYSGNLVQDTKGNVFINGTITGTNVVFHNTTGKDTLKSAGGSDVFYAKYDSSGTCFYAKNIGSKEDNYSGALVLTADSLLTLFGYLPDSMDFNPAPQKNVLYTPNPTGYVATYKSSSGAYVSAKDIGVFGYFRDESNIVDMTQDKQGNTYAVGRYSGITDFDPSPDTVLLPSHNDISKSPGSYKEDPFIAKYDAQGRLVYVRTFTTTGQDALINGLAVDDNQNVYICGTYFGQINYVPGTDTAVFGKTSSYAQNLFFAKYNKDGKYLFSLNLKSDISSFTRIALDKQKNIYLAGTLDGRAHLNPADSTVITSSYSSEDMMIVKYDSTGRFLYVNHFGQDGTVQGYPNHVFMNDMAVSDSGHVVVCGELRGSKTDFDPGAGKYFLSSGKSGDTYFAAAYSADGDLLYATAADTSSSGQTAAYHLALDGENAVVTGIGYDAADLYPGPAHAVMTNKNARNPFFIKYNSSGAIQFINTNMVTAADSNFVDVSDIAVDSSHRIYISGYNVRKVDFDFGNNTAYLDTDANYIARYDGSGNYDYVQGLSSTYPYSYNNGLFVNRNNEVVVAGGGYGTVDLDPGTDSLLFRTPVYRHSAFYITRYQQLADDKKSRPLIALNERGTFFYRKLH